MNLREVAENIIDKLYDFDVRDDGQHFIPEIEQILREVKVSALEEAAQICDESGKQSIEKADRSCGNKIVELVEVSRACDANNLAAKIRGLKA